MTGGAESATNLSTLGTDCADSVLEELHETLDGHGTSQSLETRFMLVGQQAVERAVELMDRAGTIVRNPEFKTHTISAAGGAVTLGTIGGCFGLASGVVVGSAAGVLPALLTFGLSIPAGAAAAGGVGLCVGTGSGALVGGVAGIGGCRYRVQIKDNLIFVRKTLKNTARASQVRFERRSQALRDFTGKKCGQARAIGTDPTFQVTSASAAAGAVMGSTFGGCAGLFTGAAAGLVPAIFTFGLSIPVGATVGLCTGAVGGATVGAVGGGVTGYNGYTHRKELSDGAQRTWKTARNSVEYVKMKAADSAAQVRSSVKALVGGGTGGTA
eukprot:TRINITY_DN101929_c0_g1_i1.p1 TRINITY_DN101929_c0_g1~~TRINITY_DN101929_c0_g1_i1.p1  ORF type:complete len:327 (+),score=70.61 TRINITY_DN101929_c0_g1_i1:91-1071(+)